MPVAAPRRPLQDGDIVNVDVTAYLDGFHGDTSRTFLVGDVVSVLSLLVPLRFLTAPLGRTKRAASS